MHGLYLLWWYRRKHIRSTLAVLLAAGDLALMALEVPTGWFAISRPSTEPHRRIAV